MLKTLVRLTRDVRAVSAVEFALVCGPLLLFVFGIIEFARARWCEEALNQTAITVARCMGMALVSCASSGSYSASATSSYAQAVAATWGLTVPSGNVALNQSATCGGLTGFSQVTLTYQFTTIAPNLISSLTAGKTFTATACFPNAPAT